MSVSTRVIGNLTAPFEVKTDSPIDVTSVDVNTQDEIIPSQKLGAGIGSKTTIQAVESNGKAVKLQPWVSLDGTNWQEVDFLPSQKEWNLNANDADVVFFKDTLSFLYFKLTGYLSSAGTAKVNAIVIFR